MSGSPADDLAGLIDRARALEEQGQPALACRLYAQWLHGRMREGTSKDPVCAVAWFNLGLALERQGKNAEALTTWQQDLPDPQGPDGLAQPQWARGGASAPVRQG